ncbi:hypothetical protein CEXT_156741 [Caerostris extrusa]|uniref:Secreted protein n=1 Tax=Caerostris extrusa TaxID=172846 RepID=A0AAV4N9W1_CAEEX|nr:hypothetical protein CEXT_156741 [Caerostris extrusa]
MIRTSAIRATSLTLWIVWSGFLLKSEFYHSSQHGWQSHPHMHTRQKDVQFSFPLKVHCSIKNVWNVVITVTSKPEKRKGKGKEQRKKQGTKQNKKRSQR